MRIFGVERARRPGFAQRLINAPTHHEQDGIIVMRVGQFGRDTDDFDVLSLRAFEVASRDQLTGKIQPGLRQSWSQLNGATKFSHRLVVSPQPFQSQAQIVVRRRIIRPEIERPQGVLSGPTEVALGQ